MVVLAVTGFESSSLDDVVSVEELDDEFDTAPAVEEDGTSAATIVSTWSKICCITELIMVFSCTYKITRFIYCNNFSNTKNMFKIQGSYPS